MGPLELQPVVDWMRSTDLSELSRHDEGGGLSLRLEGRGAGASIPLPACTLAPVVSPEVGLFRWNQLGSSRRAEKGQDVSEGAVLGLVDTGRRLVEVKAPVSGRVVSSSVEDGKPVECGQLILLIQPR